MILHLSRIRHTQTKLAMQVFIVMLRYPLKKGVHINELMTHSYNQTSYNLMKNDERT